MSELRITGYIIEVDDSDWDGLKSKSISIKLEGGRIILSDGSDSVSMPVDAWNLILDSGDNIV